LENGRIPALDVPFRLANNADLQLILSLMQQFYAIDGYEFDEPSAHIALKTLIEDSSLGRVWMIQTSAEVIGYVVLAFGYSLEYHGRDAWIDELFLLDSYRNRGLGTKTLEFVLEQCHLLGVQALHLEVEQTNVAGQALYRKMGFAAHEQRSFMTRRLDRDRV
jgi:GNAT superfamily N-acetyltransferase